MKNHISYCILLFGLFLMGKISYSQDVHFSQRLAADKQRNAAFTSQFEGEAQLFTVYRQQWQSIGVPFTTAGLFATKRFYINNPAFQFFGGLMLINDESGDAKLTSNEITLNIGSSIQLGEELFSFFISPSYTIKSVNQNALTFPSQYDREIGGFNENLGSGEAFQGESTSYFDVNVGALWETKLNDKWQLTSGISALNLLQPTESFLEQEGGQQNMGYGVQGEFDYSMSSAINLLPYISFYRAKGASETILGASVLFNTASFGPVENIKPFLFARTGIDRTSDALILGTSLSLGVFQLGASYDFNVSDLEIASNYQGGFELTLTYTAKGPQLKKKKLPCERY